MSRSLMTGISGMRTHQQKLDVVANNLANMNTIGFKSQSVLFSDLMYDSLRSGSAASEQTGGVNPQAVGSGVRLSQISRNFNQGALDNTSGVFDFAIQGEGFFALSDETGVSGDQVYTRAGAFSLDARGRLVDPATGYLVQRIGAAGEADEGGFAFQTVGDASIHVPIGASIAGEASSSIEFNGNLPSTASPPAEQQLQSFSGFQTTGGPATLSTALSDLTINQTAYAPGDNIEISGTNPDGTPYTATLAAGTATVQDLINTLNSTITGATATLEADGTLSITADNTGEGFLSMSMQDASGNVGGSNFSANSMFESQEGSHGDTFELTMDVYDIRGESHRVNFEFRKDSVNAWEVTANVNDGTGTMVDATVSGLTFSEDGGFGQSGVTGVGDGNIEIQFDGLSAPQTIELDFQSLSHLASDYAITQTQDGVPPGTLASVAVSSTGELSGLASNGRSILLAQLAIAKFSNPSALDPQGNNYFKQSMSSGEVSLGRGMAEARGQVVGGQLERSNVDIAHEFTQLIVAQRGFSANARTITVSDEVLEELTNIVR